MRSWRTAKSVVVSAVFLKRTHPLSDLRSRGIDIYIIRNAGDHVVKIYPRGRISRGEFGHCCPALASFLGPRSSVHLLRKKKRKKKKKKKKKKHRSARYNSLICGGKLHPSAARLVGKSDCEGRFHGYSHGNGERHHGRQKSMERNWKMRTCRSHCPAFSRQLRIHFPGNILCPALCPERIPREISTTTTTTTTITTRRLYKECPTFRVCFYLHVTNKPPLFRNYRNDLQRLPTESLSRSTRNIHLYERLPNVEYTNCKIITKRTTLRERTSAVNLFQTIRVAARR